MARDFGIIIEEIDWFAEKKKEFEVFYCNANEEISERTYFRNIFIDNHFVLVEIPDLCSPDIRGFENMNILGVSEFYIRAEERLYEFAKNYAQAIQRRKHYPNWEPPIVDKTSRAKESKLVENL